MSEFKPGSRAPSQETKPQKSQPRGVTWEWENFSRQHRKHRDGHTEAEQVPLQGKAGKMEDKGGWESELAGTRR